MKSLITTLLLSLVASTSFAEVYDCTINTDVGLDTSSPEARLKNQIIIEHALLTVNAPEVRIASTDLTDFPKGAVDVQIFDYVPGGRGTTPETDLLYQGMIFLKARFIPNSLETAHSPHFVSVAVTKGSRVISSLSQSFGHFVNVNCKLR